MPDRSLRGPYPGNPLYKLLAEPGVEFTRRPDLNVPRKVDVQYSEWYWLEQLLKWDRPKRFFPLDPDYHYRYHSELFNKFVTFDAIMKRMWRASNPALNAIRNLRDVSKRRELHPVIHAIRHRLYNRRFNLRLRIEYRESMRS
jgi:hypothetical protein